MAEGVAPSGFAWKAQMQTHRASIKGGAALTNGSERNEVSRSYCVHLHDRWIQESTAWIRPQTRQPPGDRWSELIRATSPPNLSMIVRTKWKLSYIVRPLTTCLFRTWKRFTRTLAQIFNSVLSIVKGRKLPIPTIPWLFLRRSFIISPQWNVGNSPPPRTIQ